MNSPVHFLDRQPPAEYLREWTARIAAQKAADETGTNSIVVFRVETEWLALRTGAFQEIAEDRPLHVIPHRRAGIVAGITTIRGELLLCISLARLLGFAPALDAANRNPRARLVVAQRGGNRVAFRVDEVHGMIRYSPREFQAVPATLVNAIATYTKAILPWQGRSVGCLDDELLFHALNKNLGA